MAENDVVDPDSSLWAWLAHDLRFYREKYGLSQPALGKIIGRSGPNISNCEAGRRRIGSKEAGLLDARFKTGGHFQRLLRYAQRGHDPDWFKQFAGLEENATVIKAYQPMLVPGLLQLSEYARALVEAGDAPNPDELLEERMRRHPRKRSPARAVGPHHGKRPGLAIGGPEVLREQLAHLLEVSERTNISIRVVPKSTGAHAGLDGGFSIITGPTGDVAYTESPGGGRLVPSTPEVRSFGMRYDRIGHVAMPTGISRKMIEQAMEAL